MNINKEILKTIKYFLFFAYYPTSDEIHTFLEAKISEPSLNIELKKMVKMKVIYEYSIENVNRYTVGEYGMKRIKNLKLRIKNSKNKLNAWRFRVYTKLISLFPQIKLIGLSGSISMMNAKEDDDIDLFIITAKNRLFTGRLIALFLAQLLGLRRYRQIEKLDTVFFDRHTPKGPLAIVSKKVSSLSSSSETMKQSDNDFCNKVCLNLFFDERDLMVPKFKHTEFVGHEALQMKPIISKQGTYERFLASNKWVFKLFPNGSLVIPAKAGIQTKSTGSPTRSGMTSHFSLLTFNFVESVLKKFQLSLINRHKTSEFITSSQLWFHPDDFEKKLS